MNDPYKVLGISPDATDDQVKAAYREMARKYHPDQYGDNPLSDLAQEKMQEINEAYDTIVRMRKEGGGSTNHANRGGRYADIRRMVSEGRIEDADTLLNGIPAVTRDAEWHFLKGSVLYKRGWLEDAFQHFSTACRMDPTNAEYRAAYNQMSRGRQTGTYTTTPVGGGCTACDVCNTLICADCCCECMGGDLIHCC
ncbi:MAG: molecular chaperone DnaJ [Ruminococcaceae bacterium]|nr:molecular chaperone DnaJ [Oscillospiraceae bacterium]